MHDTDRRRNKMESSTKSTSKRSVQNIGGLLM
jgi:hypothetical protein